MWLDTRGSAKYFTKQDLFYLQKYVDLGKASPVITLSLFFQTISNYTYCHDYHHHNRCHHHDDDDNDDGDVDDDDNDDDGKVSKGCLRPQDPTSGTFPRSWPNGFYTYHDLMMRITSYKDTTI